ncbi:MAG: prepilin-type N-terminal cleavage/methylation domain-containing protein, partial [Gemmatimonadales bacterium]
MSRSTQFARAGFTLVELLIALLIGGLVALMISRIFAATTDAGRQLGEARAALDAQANARRWLAATFLSLEVGTTESGGFEGHPGGMEFTAYQLSGDGWFERRRIQLDLTDGRLRARLENGEEIVLADSLSGLSFDYLLEPGLNSRWVADWISPVSAPLAIRIRLLRPTGGDTLLF